MKTDEHTQSLAGAGWLRRLATLRRRVLDWGPAAILGLWILAFVSSEWPELRHVARRLAVAGLASSLLWLLCWALAAARRKVSRRNLLFVWFIWVFLVSPVLLFVLEEGLDAEDSGLLMVVASIAVVALALTWLRGHCQDKWERQDHAGGELPAGRVIAQ